MIKFISSLITILSIAGFYTQERVMHDILFYDYQEYKNQVECEFGLYIFQNKTPYDLQPHAYLSEIFVDVENISVNILNRDNQPLLFSDFTNPSDIYVPVFKDAEQTLSFEVFYNNIHTLNPTIRAPGISCFLT